MIDVKDLMVGNWVKSPQGITQVHNVLTDKIITKNDKRGVNCYHTTDIEPIPVTLDILKRIGFEAHRGICPKTFYRYWDKEYRYKLDVDPDFCNSDRKFSIHIDNGDCETIGSGEFDYVHELQNLVRINCKADLPITKEVFDGLDD
mgnify:CR=1 FL=1